MEPTQNPNVNPNVQPTPENGNVPETLRAPGSPEAAPVAPSNPTAGNTPAVPAAPVQVPQGQPQSPVSGSQPPNSNPVAGAPAVAGDVDVIEKEWVDQANKIVNQTKEDPYAEEEAVEALQVDYLKKRYGHNVKKQDEK